MRSRSPGLVCELSFHDWCAIADERSMPMSMHRQNVCFKGSQGAGKGNLGQPHPPPQQRPFRSKSQSPRKSRMHLLLHHLERRLLSSRRLDLASLEACRCLRSFSFFCSLFSWESSCSSGGWAGGQISRGLKLAGLLSCSGL